MNADVSIVIPTWNGVELLKRFFPSVIRAAAHYRQTTGNDIEIVLVNDAGSDATPEWLNAEYLTGKAAMDIRLLTNEENLGFGKSVNRGIREARYPLVLLLNNDVEVDEDAIAPLVAHFTDPSVFAVHCRVFEFESRRECGSGQLGSFARGSIRVHQRYQTPPESHRRDCRRRPLYSIFATGGAAMYARDTFLALGAFEELLSPSYWEDVDISYRAWKRGYTVLYEPLSIVHHRISSTMGKLNRRKLWRVQQRNRLIFHWLNLHDRRLFASHLLWLTFLTLTALLRLQPLFLLAVLDALRHLPQIRQRRREEMALAKRSDREVFEVFRELRE